MAGIWNNINIEWEGEEISVKPTLDFINKIEQKQGASLSLLLQRIQAGDLPVGMGCHVIAVTLKEAGINITDDEIYGKVLELNGQIGNLVGTIIAGCLPMPKNIDVGKPQV